MTGPQQYQVQFSTTEEHLQLIERAKALLAREAPGKSLGELHLQAMKLLVTALEKQKFAVTERPRKTAPRHRAPSAHSREPTPESLPAQPAALRHPTQGSASTTPAAKLELGQKSGTTRPAGAHDPVDSPPRQRGRHIPAEVRRAVFERDGGRCNYVDERGERCRETRSLELHHQQPFGKRGPHTVENLTLHCPAHNALAAELDFGREHMAVRRDPLRHESLASEERRELGDTTEWSR